MSIASESLAVLVPGEADALAYYLIDAECPAASSVDYERALIAHGAKLLPREQKVWLLMVRYPLFMRCIDAALALQSPSSTIRKRIFIMLCMLETEPGLCHHFLPVNRPPGHVFFVGLRGFRAVMAAIAGLLMLRIYRLHID
jgi:hypothetical protein